MRRKILALFGMLSLLLYSIPVQAANNLPISFGNSYTAPTMGGGRTSILYLSQVITI